MAQMFRIGRAVASDNATLEFKIPDGGVIITQASIMGLMGNAEPQTVTIQRVRVVDKIDVERYKGRRIPGKVAGNTRLFIETTCPGAIATTITLACTARTIAPGGEPDHIDADLEVKDTDTP